MTTTFFFKNFGVYFKQCINISRKEIILQNIIILIFIYITNIAFFLDITIIRQIFGFVFLTIIPGLLLINLINEQNIDNNLITILTIGLSVTFILFFGILFYFFTFQLSGFTFNATHILLILDLIYIVLILINIFFIRTCYFHKQKFSLNTIMKGLIGIGIILPPISILGVYLMNDYGINLVVYLSFIITTILIILICYFNKYLSSESLSFFVFIISLSIVLLYSLRSYHLLGVDTHFEYFQFKTLLTYNSWQNSLLDSDISSLLNYIIIVNIFPYLYYLILDIPPEFLFKILFSIIFAFSPLIIFAICNKYFDKIYSFLGSIFFVFQMNFMTTPIQVRTNIAIMFIMLFIMTLLLLKNRFKSVLLVLFFISSMFCHYTSPELFCIILVFAYIIEKVLNKFYKFEKMLSFNVVFSCLAVTFFWYGLIMHVIFGTSVHFFDYFSDSLLNTVWDQGKSTYTTALLGENIVKKGIPHIIEFFITWMILLTILIGFIYTTIITMFKKIKISFFEKLLEPHIKIDSIVVILGFCFLCSYGCMMYLPYLSQNYGIDRVYFVGLSIMSIFFLMGALIIPNTLNYKKGYLLILLILLPYFFCVNGSFYQIYGYPRSLLLNNGGTEYQYEQYYIPDEDSISAVWMDKFIDNSFKINVMDGWTINRLISQSNRRLTHLDIFQQYSSERSSNNDEYFYLRYYNVKNNIINFKSYNKNLIYSSGVKIFC